MLPSNLRLMLQNAIENMYFTKEDQRLMSKLLTKIKDQVCACA